MDFLRQFPHAIFIFGRGAVLSVMRNLSLALLAAALGLSLWLFVTDRENPDEAQAFSSAIPVRFVNVPNGLAVANTSETSVRIRIEGPQSELQKLQSDDFQATADLGGLEKGESAAVVSVNSSRRRVDVTEVTPGRVTVTLESLRTKEVRVAVSLVGSPQQGFAAAGQTTDPETATVSGPESLVALVDSAVAEVNLTGLRSSFTDRVELEPRDVRGGEISRVTVNPQRASVNIDIEQREFSQEFVVTPLVTGQPAAGYNVAGISIDPRLVTVTGPLDVLQSIDAVRGVATEETSITDERADVQRNVQVILPPGVRLQGASTVKVTVSIKPARGEAAFRVVPQVRNVGAGLAVVSSDAVVVTLAGDVPSLQALTPEAIIAIVDAQDLGPGLYALPLQVTPPAGTTVVRTDPGELGIALVQRPE
jgi:YbbR domain-containing protein